jgi:hypothetical protein
MMRRDWRSSSNTTDVNSHHPATMKTEATVLERLYGIIAAITVGARGPPAESRTAGGEQHCCRMGETGRYSRARRGAGEKGKKEEVGEQRPWEGDDQEDAAEAKEQTEAPG